MAADENKLIGKLRELLARQDDIRLSIVFGSVAGGTQNSESDLDIAVLADSTWATLVTKHLFDAADFLPYRNRMLRERREAWIKQ